MQTVADPTRPRQDIWRAYEVLTRIPLALGGLFTWSYHNSLSVRPGEHPLDAYDRSTGKPDRQHDIAVRPLSDSDNRSYLRFAQIGGAA